MFIKLLKFKELFGEFKELKGVERRSFLERSEKKTIVFPIIWRILKFKTYVFNSFNYLNSFNSLNS